MMFSSQLIKETAGIFGSPPPAIVQVDLDGYWAIRRCYGKDPEGSFEHDPVFQHGIPLMFKLFEKHNIPASLFVIGKDLKVDSKSNIINRAAKLGHRIGNHTFSHSIEFSSLSIDEVKEEIENAQTIIERSTGSRSTLFRAPGYNINTTILSHLGEAGFKCDSSVLPSPWGFAFRGISRFISLGSNAKRKGQFGSANTAGAPWWPYYPSIAKIARESVRPGSDLIEWPVSVDPLTRLPLTGTILFLLGWPFFHGALKRISRLGLPLNLVLHGIDFVDTKLYPPLDSFHGNVFFSTSAQRKHKLLENLLQFLNRNFRLTSEAETVTRLTKI